MKAEEAEKAKAAKEKDKQEKRKAEQEKRGGRPSRKPRTPGRPALLTIAPTDDDSVKVLASPTTTAIDFSEPFLVSNQTWLQTLVDSNAAAKAAFDDFTKVFDNSSLKVTEGRAQQRVRDPAVGKAILQEICACLG